MIILIDSDGVLADFEKSVSNNWRLKYPDRIFIPLEKRTIFKVCDEYPPEFKKDVERIYQSPEFFENLSPIPGAIEAVNKMRQLGHEVFICSAPISRYEDCVLEKYKWVEKYFGREFTKRVILTKDKTLIHGDYLIDDKPTIDGIRKPDWEQVIFDTPYNREVKDKKRITWGNWEQVLNLS